MSEAKPLVVAVRFPSYASVHWRGRCVAALKAAGSVEVVLFSDSTVMSAVDLVLDLGTRNVDPRQLAVPRLGYWTLLYGEEPERIYPGLKALLGGKRAAFVRLVQLTRTHQAHVLKEGVVKAVSHSLRATRNRLLEAVVDWPGQQLREQLTRKERTARCEIRVAERPLPARIALWALYPLAWLRNVLRRVGQELTSEHWAVGVIDKPVEEVLRSFDPAAISWLPGPPGDFLADPFGHRLPDGSLIILAEALSRADGHGRLVALRRQADDSLEPPRDVLPLNSHASYPQIIEHAGTIYCLPEISAQGRVQLFRAAPFPDTWVPDKVLLNGFAGADATVCLHEGRWWMFAGDHADQDETKLFVFHAEDLLGPWLPHARNPVKIDLRSSRPAGALFTTAGALYRPAQDCSQTYGGAVVINRIIQLTPGEFSEAPVGRLTPDTLGPYPNGLHTLNGVGNLTLVDGKRHAMSFRNAVAKLPRLRLGPKPGRKQVT